MGGAMEGATEGTGRIRSRLEASLGLDLRSLAAFRIALAGLLLLDLALRARQLRMFYTDQGAVSAYFFAQQLAKTIPWPHYWNGSLGFQSALFVLAAGFAFAMLLGYRTRTATLLSWIMLCSLHFRNGAILTFGDTIWRLLLFFSVFLPLGARWSLDARAQRVEAAARSPGPRVLSVGAVAFQLQILFIYVFSGLHKTGAAWTQGTAVHDSLSVDYFATTLGTQLLQFPILLEGLTYGTFVVELGLPWLFFSPVASAHMRLFAALALVGFHIGLGATMRFGLFQLVPCAAMLVFVPTFVWDRILARRAAE